MLFVPCSIYSWSNVCQGSNITRGALFGNAASFFCFIEQVQKSNLCEKFVRFWIIVYNYVKLCVKM